jgi:HEAT repeat protein
VLELDGLLRAWNQSKLSANADDEPKHRALDLDLRRGARQRLDLLIELLETGAPRNRQVAAMAIGFSGSERALPPLLAALDDELPAVVQNALIGLGLLAQADTPLEKIRRLLLEAPESKTRNNAGFALQRLLEVGVRSPGLLDDLRLALIDPEPGVRVQAATSLRLLQDPKALPDLADRLQDNEDLVAVAAARAMRRIGQEIDAECGRCARNLFEAWKEAKGNRKAALQYEMAVLRRGDLGDKEEDWREWAYKLP